MGVELVSKLKDFCKTKLEKLSKKCKYKKAKVTCQEVREEAMSLTNNSSGWYGKCGFSDTWCRREVLCAFSDSKIKFRRSVSQLFCDQVNQF